MTYMIISRTVPYLYCPHVSHHLTRLPIYISLVRAILLVKINKFELAGGGSFMAEMERRDRYVRDGSKA
jgi:hypothetical protein